MGCKGSQVRILSPRPILPNFSSQTALKIAIVIAHCPFSAPVEIALFGAEKWSCCILAWRCGFDFEDRNDENSVFAPAFLRRLRRRCRCALSDEARGAFFLVSHLAGPARGAGGGLEADRCAASRPELRGHCAGAERPRAGGDAYLHAVLQSGCQNRGDDQGDQSRRKNWIHWRQSRG